MSLPARLLGGCTALTLAAALGACAVGNVPPGGPTGDGPQRVPSGDPDIEFRLDGLGITCESTMIVTGTFTPGIAQPPELLGCWPVGTWTINATLDRVGCDPQPMFTDNVFDDTYVYEVTYNEETSTQEVQFVNDPSDLRVNLKISTEGDSLCHGSFDHFALDGTIVGFRAALMLDNTLQGIGTYTVYPEDTF